MAAIPARIFVSNAQQHFCLLSGSRCAGSGIRG
jgi:hypothetical protein